jgi:fatty acid synthase subunit beta
MDMYCETPSGPAGELERQPIFPSITETSTSFTHKSPNGLLFSTQFAQPALTIMELAAFRDMQSQGVVDHNAVFAGHSLGEYAALAAITDFMPFERLLYIVFCRGMTMQLAVKRDASGKSGFGMLAVDPGRVGDGFDDSALQAVVDAIGTAGYFIEIVNFNIRGSQYVCAGDLRALDMLQKLLDQITTGKPEAATPYPSLIETHSSKYSKLLPSEISLKRGSATIPLTGVDVPFHSSFLRSRMEAFRRVLLANLEAGHIQPEKLVGKYIPNVTGRPFGISKSHCEDIWTITKSESVRHVLDTWDDRNGHASHLMSEVS